MKANSYGRIVSASSINGTAGAFGQTNYCATKAGISGFTRALCKEVGKYGITANDDSTRSVEIILESLIAN